MELGRRPAGGVAFFDDFDRSYVVAQLEGAMDGPVELHLAVRRTSPLLLPGDGATAARASEEARRAEQFANELATLVPRITVTVSDSRHDVPVFGISIAGATPVRFVGVPRVNLFRVLLETIRRASTQDHGLPADRARALDRMPGEVHARAFATPTCPSCPPVVVAAVQMALASERVRVDVVDGISGMELVREWRVSGVPTVVLNDRLLVEGPVPDDTLFEFFVHAGDDSHAPPPISSVPFRSCGRLETD